MSFSNIFSRDKILLQVKKTNQKISALTMGLSHSYTGDEPQKKCFMLIGCSLFFPFHFKFKNKDRFSADSWRLSAITLN